MTFSVLFGMYIVIQAYGFVMFLGIDYDENKHHKLVMIE
jgi:hypothetical protein